MSENLQPSQEKQSPVEQKPRKPYAAPVLEDYGLVRELTHAGIALGGTDSAIYSSAI